MSNALVFQEGEHSSVYEQHRGHVLNLTVGGIRIPLGEEEELLLNGNRSLQQARAVNQTVAKLVLRPASRERMRL